MKAARILGILILIAGVVMLFYSNYINNQLGEGRSKVASAQRKVDIGNSLLSLNPETKQYGEEMVTSRVQEKINEGKMTIAEYQRLADRLQTWGIVLIVGGGVVFLVSFMGGIKSRR